MSDRIEKAAMASDETIQKVARALWECDNLEFMPEWRDKVWNDMGGPEPSYERVDYETRAEYLAEAGLLAPAPLSEEIETDRLMQFGGPVAVIERRRRWVTDWESVE